MRRKQSAPRFRGSFSTLNCHLKCSTLLFLRSKASTCLLLPWSIFSATISSQSYFRIFWPMGGEWCDFDEKWLLDEVERGRMTNPVLKTVQSVLGFVMWHSLGAIALKPAWNEIKEKLQSKTWSYNPWMVAEIRGCLVMRITIFVIHNNTRVGVRPCSAHPCRLKPASSFSSLLPRICHL